MVVVVVAVMLLLLVDLLLLPSETVIHVDAIVAVATVGGRTRGGR